MTHWLKTLRSFFFIKTKPIANLAFACSINLEQISEQLKIKEKAINAARSELPNTRAIKPDGSEREIQNYFAKRMADINAITNEKLSRYNTSIVDTNLQDEHAGINNQTNHTKLELKSVMTREFRFLQIVKQERDSIATELLDFQTRNNLLRNAYYPDSQILFFAFILLVWLIESVCNGYFFAKGSEYGILGGVMQATIIAAINIATGFFVMGSIFRYKNHAKLWKRIGAYLGLLIYVIVITGFNLFVAHYRDIFAVQADDAGNLAIQHFTASPFSLAEFDSWLLFFLGLLFSILAFVDGYKRDDAYPGYGKLHRRVQEQKHHYEEYRLGIVQQVEELRQQFLSQLETMHHNVQKKHTRLVHLVEEKQALVNEHNHGIANFINAANALIHQYREANMAVRNTPPPCYFHNEWQTTQEYSLRGDHDDAREVNEQSELYKEFPHYAQQRANEIEILYVNFFQKLHELDPNSHTRPTPVEALA